MTDHRNDPHRHRQSLDDWRWLAAEAEAADRHEEEAREEASRAPAPRIPWWVPFADDWRSLAAEAEAEAADRHEQEAREEASRAPRPRVPRWLPFALAVILPALAYLIAEAYRA